MRGISTTAWNELNQNAYRPLANKATQGLYPPGSTYKMIVALAALGGRAGHAGMKPSIAPATWTWATAAFTAGAAAGTGG